MNDEWKLNKTQRTGRKGKSKTWGKTMRERHNTDRHMKRDRKREIRMKCCDRRKGMENDWRKITTIMKTRKQGK